MKIATLIASIFVFSASVFSQVINSDDWKLVSFKLGQMNNYQIEGKEITLTIDTKDGRVSGNSGCNLYMGPFRFEDSGRLTVGPFAGTFMACAKVDERFEKMYRETLEGADSFSFENGILTFRDDQAQTFLRFERIKKPEIFTWYVNKDVVDCVGVVKTKCLQIKDSKTGSWQNFFGPIDGFDFKKGRFYLIEIERKRRENPPADASVYTHRLIRIVKSSKKEKDL
jgi:heat shock protein HslJ